MKSRLQTLADTADARVLKWSLMSGAVFWAVVYKLSERGLKVPDFVYVNF